MGSGHWTVGAARGVRSTAMTIPVDIGDLARALEDFGSGYLLTASPDGRVKVVTVDATVREGVLLVPGTSRGSAANLAANPAATVVFWPREVGGYSLIIDGSGEETAAGFEITPAKAVLHRPAVTAGAPDDGSCGHDCRPL